MRLIDRPQQAQLDGAAGGGEEDLLSLVGSPRIWNNVDPGTQSAMFMACLEGEPNGANQGAQPLDGDQVMLLELDPKQQKKRRRNEYDEDDDEEYRPGQDDHDQMDDAIVQPAEIPRWVEAGQLVKFECSSRNMQGWARVNMVGNNFSQVRLFVAPKFRKKRCG